MTLDIGSPFDVTAKPYIIAAVAEDAPAQVLDEDVAESATDTAVPSDMNMASSEPEVPSPAGQSTPTILILVIVALLVGIGIAVLGKRGKA
jgi:hypothetical protein